MIKILFCGFPCFVAGTQVYTDKGYKSIEDIRVGDMVLTHKGRFRNGYFEESEESKRRRQQRYILDNEWCQIEG